MFASSLPRRPKARDIEGAVLLAAIAFVVIGFLAAGYACMIGFNVAEHAGYGHGIGFWSACWLALFVRIAIHVNTKTSAG